MEILLRTNISKSVKHIKEPQMHILNSCTLSTFLNTLLNPEISKCCKGMCFSLHFRDQETMQHGKGRPVLEKTVCFLLELYMVLYRLQAVTATHRIWHCSGSLKSSPDKLSSWLLPFKMTFGCDSYKITQESGGRQAESFPCPSPKFSQIPKRWCTWCFDNSVYAPKWLQANEKTHYKRVMWIRSYLHSKY